MKAMVKSLVISSIVLLVLGCLMLLAPAAVLATYIRIIGGVILAGAACAIILQLVSAAPERSVAVMIIGILCALVGLVFLIAPDAIAGALPFVFGILLILLSVGDLASALKFPVGKLFSILLSLVGLVLGILIVYHPNGLANIITRLIGLALIYQAVVGFIQVFRIKRSVHW